MKQDLCQTSFNTNIQLLHQILERLCSRNAFLLNQKLLTFTETSEEFPETQGQEKNDDADFHFVETVFS